jgi:hypothetical protein
MVMLLNGDNGAEFELALIQDRYPELRDGAADSNWLTLSFRVGTQDESWEETSPCMNIFELQTLQEWLQAVGEGSPDIPEVELLEPALRFSVTRQRPDSVTIRIDFQLENRPEEFAVNADTDEAEHIVVVLSREQIRAAATELRRDLDAVTNERVFEQIEGENLGVIGVPDEDLGLRPSDDTIEDSGADQEEDEPRA